MKKTLMILAGAAVLSLGGAGFWFSQGTQTMPDLGSANAQEAQEVDVSTIKEMVLGSEEAPVTITEYASLTCPHCANFHKTVLKPLKAEYIDTGKVKLIYRDVYFDRIGLWGSMIARCDAEKFFGVNDLLYTQQDKWLESRDPATISDELRKIGRIAGLDNDQLEACLTDNDRARTLVTWFQQNAEADDISATPTILIDGEKYSNMSYADLKKIIDEKIGE